MLGIILKIVGVRYIAGFLWGVIKICFNLLFFPTKAAFRVSFMHGCIVLVITIVISWAFLIYFMQRFNENTPWNNMVDYMACDPSTKQKLIEMGMIASYAYDDTYLYALRDAGYQMISPRLKQGELNYVTMMKDSVLYIGFRGTADEADVLDDILIATTNSNLERFSTAAHIVESSLNNKNIREVVITGHSLGGSAVQYVVWSYHTQRMYCPMRLRAFTFNPYAFPCGEGVTKVDDDLLTDVVQESDIAQVVRQKDRVVGRGILVHGRYVANSKEPHDAGFFSMGTQHSITGLVENMKSQKDAAYNPSKSNASKESPPQKMINMSDILKDTL